MILLISGIFVLTLWWLADLQYQTYTEEWIVESTEYPEFLAAEGRNVITAIGLCNDEPISDSGFGYESISFDGTVGIVDSNGTIIWERVLSNYSIPTLTIEKADDLLTGTLVLEEGETYTFYIYDNTGSEMEGITWVFYGEEMESLVLYLAICAGLILFLSLLYFLYCRKSRLPFGVIWFVLLIGISVLGMLAMAPLSVPDEFAHLGGAYALSNQILELFGFDSLCDEISLGILRMENFGDMQYTMRFWMNWGYGNDTLSVAEEYVRNATELNSAPFYGYIVPAIGLTIMRILRAPWQISILFSRLMNVIMYASVTLLAVRFCPNLRPCVLAVSFLPSTLLLMCSFSYDTWNLAFCILFVCWCVRMGRADSIGAADLVGAFLILVAFVPIKFVYINYIILLLVVKREQIRNLRRTLAVVLAAIAATAAAMMLTRGTEVLSYLSSTGYDEHTSLTAETSYSIGWVLNNPIRTVLICVRTLFESGGSMFIKMFLGENYYKYVPGILFLGIVSVFFIIMLGSSDARRREKWTAGAVLLTGLGIILASFLLVYSEIPEKGIGTIDGLQGRYFIPYLICLPLVLPSLSWAGKHSRQAQYLLMCLTAVTIVVRFGGVLHGVI